VAPPLAMPKNFKHNFFFSNHVPMDPSIVASLSQNVKSIVLVVDPTQVEAKLVNNKKKNKL
jgi:hypothetical protein